jgi:ATP-dependent DNA helicase RecG
MTEHRQRDGGTNSRQNALRITMTLPIERLTKILQLEKEKYQDRAVVGGLARYADAWLQEAQKAFGPEAADWIQKVADHLRAYSSLPDPAARQKAVATLLETLEAVRSGDQSRRTEKPVERRRRPERVERSKPQSARKRTGLDSSVAVLRGVGPQRSKQLVKLGIHTIRDMLYLLPRRYDDFSQLKPINRLEYDEEITIIARVQRAFVHKTRGSGKIFKATLSDGTGSIEAAWFNQPYLADKIKHGHQIVVSGKVDEYMGRLCFTSPEWEPLEKELLHTARIVPVYPLTAGLNARWLRDLMKRTVSYWSKRLPDYLPTSVQQEENLLALETAVVQAHFPDSQKLLKQARYRLAFDELFVLQIGMLRQRHRWRSASGRSLPVNNTTLDNFIHGLPFKLTQAQQRALQRIVADLRSSRPMNRLLQGDVGSGKTVVAAAAMALTVAAGSQAAVMAPTEILAGQHYQTMSRLLEQMPGRERGPTVRLLTGSVTGQEREEILAGLEDGSVDVIVGTHALIQTGVQFKSLALAVIDEQHRFGVRQRAALRQKGYNPHLLVMTATPIPRSLQLTVWGHLDVSVIDEMPPGREPIVTRLILPTERERAYAFVRSQIEKGRQVFIICPLVEESEKIEAKAAVDEHRRLQKYIFPDLQVGLLHGRMKGEEKEATMARFVQGELDILVATSVIEVGIDVPNATVMLIEGADRFGLAQLHQFRGRVGRGEHASYCLLVSDTSSPEAQERLQAVEATNDGFALAQKDLEMRGPGEFLGARQSGFPELKLSSITNLRLVEAAREAARRFFKTDPELTNPRNRLLAQRVARFWKEKGEIS